MVALLVGDQARLEGDGVVQRALEPVLERGQALVCVDAAAGAVADGDDADLDCLGTSPSSCGAVAAIVSRQGHRPTGCAPARNSHGRRGPCAVPARDRPRWHRVGGGVLRAWRISARSCWMSVPGVVGNPFGLGAVLGDEAVAPLLGQVQRQLFGGRAAALLSAARLAWRPRLSSSSLRISLPTILHLAALALKVGDAPRLGQRFDQLVGQADAREQVSAQAQQLFAQVLAVPSLSRLRSVRLASGVPLSSALSAMSSSLPSATNWPRTK